MPATAMIHVRMDNETKEQAQKAFDDMGLTISEAVRLFFHRVAKEQALPFAVKTPNAETRAAMERGRKISEDKNHVWMTDINQLFEVLDAAAKKQ